MAERVSCPFAPSNQVAMPESELFFDGFEWTETKPKNTPNILAVPVVVLIREVLAGEEGRFAAMLRHYRSCSLEFKGKRFSFPNSIKETLEEVQGINGYGENLCDACRMTVLFLLNRVMRPDGGVLAEAYVPPNTEIEVPSMTLSNLVFMDKTEKDEEGNEVWETETECNAKVVVAFNEQTQMFEVNFAVYKKPDGLKERMKELQHERLIENDNFKTIDPKDNRNFGGCNSEISFKAACIEILVHNKSKKFGELKGDRDLIIEFLKQYLTEKFSCTGKPINFTFDFSRKMF